jgi:phosphoribosylformylglycinamidine synthase subunit PurQ / glutaminase
VYRRCEQEVVLSARVGVVVFPGACDEQDAVLAIDRVEGLEGELLPHGERDLKDSDAVVLPGGFSYGDYLRAGAIARFAPVMEAVGEFAREGGPVLGICNGFQVLCEAGMLPGALLVNESLKFVCRQVRLRIESRSTPFTSALSEGEELSMPVKHTTGRWFTPPDLLDRVETSGQIVVRYTGGTNPNGSMGDVAGVANEAGNVFGLMPHIEHATDELTGSTDGLRLFGSLAGHMTAVPA